MKLEILILSEVKSERERQIPYDIAYIWNLYMAQTNLRNKLMDMENRLVVAKEEGEAKGWTGSLGLIDAHYCLWNG